MPTTSRAVSPQDRQSLRNHVVNLRQGQFSTDGDFSTTRQDVERIFAVALPAALAEAKAANRKLRLLFYAHGGLVDEADGIGRALTHLPFWKANNIYPIFFIWETGILEVLADLLRRLLIGQRGVGEALKELKAKALEGLARPGGVRIWGNMKLSAQAASAADGGAQVVASLAARFFSARRDDMEIHSCGHSAGAIFHTFFLPALTSEGVDVASLHLLAPAVNVPTFRARILPLVGHRLGAITMFTMEREFERDDTAGPYPKSLLYFVHHAFEDPDETPILGLEENLVADAALEAALTTAPNEVVFSVTDPAAGKRSSSRSIHHGDFDNDAATMNSVCRRILGVSDGTAIVDYSETRGRGFDPLERLNQELAAAAAGPGRDAAADVGGPTGVGRSNATGDSAAAAGAIPDTANAGTAGRKTALCIGVDTYPAPDTLHGCVNDSRVWEELFREFGYSVSVLRDGAATRAAITEALAQHVAALKAGDVCLIQYAGHGVQFPDDSGDEPDNKDEALCPVDMMTAGFIRDDEVRAILNRIPPGARVFCFMDCCHSSSIARMVRQIGQDDGSRIRAITPTPEMILVHRQTRTAGRVAPPAVRRDVVFAACRDDQVAFESAGHGDYTTLAVPIIRQHGKGVTNIALQKLIQVEFGSGARQNPTLDCSVIDEAQAFLLP